MAHVRYSSLIHWDRYFKYSLRTELIFAWLELVNKIEDTILKKILRGKTIMSHGITKTIPAGDGIETINALYDGSFAEYEFHMAGNPSKLNVGDYVYTIFGDQLYGRLKIKEMVGGATNPKSGKARTLLIVEAPGERLVEPIPKKSHRGTRYYDGADWPES